MDSNIPVSSGIRALDDVIQGLRPGDNVVWQLDSLHDYAFVAAPFLRQAQQDGRPCIYLRFAAHPPLVAAGAGVEIVELDPATGFDAFSRQVCQLIQARGKRAAYLFDNLSALVAAWKTDQLLATFFQATCPLLFELDTVTYFALSRGQHAHQVVAAIRDTTQVLIDVFHIAEQRYLHPVKVFGRYSPQMFLPHLASGEVWEPVFDSREAALLSAAARPPVLNRAAAGHAPWDTVYAKLAQYRDLDPEIYRFPAEAEALKAELSHMLFGADREFNAVAARFLSNEELLAIRERVIGSGHVGGKAAGLLLAGDVLRDTQAGRPWTGALDPDDSFYIGTDVFFSFLVENNLFRLRAELARDPDRARTAFAEVEKRFLDGRFPDSVVRQCRQMLDYYGQAPVAVRASSLLEERFASGFTGRYRTEFCVNQGVLEDRLQAFLRAVRLVYASVLHPDAVAARQQAGLGDGDEQMAVLVQRVAGFSARAGFFPALSGAAWSRAPSAGAETPVPALMRLRAGLNLAQPDTRDADLELRFALPGARRAEPLVAAGQPGQRLVGVLDLVARRAAVLPAADAFAGGYPGTAYLLSERRGGSWLDLAPGAALPEACALTGNRLVRDTDFLPLLGSVLQQLETVYRQPVGVEFTVAVDDAGRVRLNLLQCRPAANP